MSCLRVIIVVWAETEDRKSLKHNMKWFSELRHYVCVQTVVLFFGLVLYHSIKMPNPLLHSLCVGQTNDVLSNRRPWLFTFFQVWKWKRCMVATDLVSMNVPCRCSLFIVCIVLYDIKKRKQRCVFCELLTVCHCFRSNVSYRLLCDVLKQSASPFRYTVEKKKMQCQLFSNASTLE